MSRFLRQHALLYLVGRCACYPRPNPALTDFSIALPVVASGRTLAPAAAVVPAPVAAAPAPLTALRLLACAGHFFGIGVAEESAARPPPRPRTPLRRAPCWPLHHTHSPTLSLHLHSPLHLSPPPQLPLPSLTHLPSSLPYPHNPSFVLSVRSCVLVASLSLLLHIIINSLVFVSVVVWAWTCAAPLERVALRPPHTAPQNKCGLMAHGGSVWCTRGWDRTSYNVTFLRRN